MPDPLPSAVVIGATGGLGAALVEALRDEDVPVRGLARSLAGADHLDLTDEASIAASAASLAAPPTLVIVATGLLHDAAHGPEKQLADLDPAWLARQYAVNAIGPALVAKHFLPRMPRTGRNVFAILSARVGSIGDNKLGGWYGYRASRRRCISSSGRSRSRSAGATTAQSSWRSTPARSTRCCQSRSRQTSRPGACSRQTAPPCSCSTSSRA